MPMGLAKSCVLTGTISHKLALGEPLEMSRGVDRGFRRALALSGSSLFAPAFESGDELVLELDSQLSPWSWEIEQDTLFCAPDLLRLHGVTTLSTVGASQFDATQSLGTDAPGPDLDGVTGARGWL